MTQTALILGASGRFGRNAAEQFSKAGWDIRRFDRSQGELTKAVQGVDVIVNGWNPLYPDWSSNVPDLTRRIIVAARQSGATVIIPGNVYVFGQSALSPWSDSTPHGARNPLGRVRIEMEAEYRSSGVRCILLRGGDFIDTQSSGNWFDAIMTKHLAKGVFTYPGTLDIDHAWAYLPDFCRAAVLLAEKGDGLPVFSDISFPGYTVTGSDIAAILSKVTGSPLRVKQMSWLPFAFARPFWRMARYLSEMRYLWDTPHRLDGKRFDDLLPAFHGTPIEQALAAALPKALVQHQIHPDQPVPAGG